MNENRLKRKINEKSNTNWIKIFVITIFYGLLDIFLKNWFQIIKIATRQNTILNKTEKMTNPPVRMKRGLIGEKSEKPNGCKYKLVVRKPIM